MNQTKTKTKSRWNNAVIYEVYLRSFLDTSGNGEGDIAGVIKKLDYLDGLGVNAIWLTPFYPSPMKDGGYDVTNSREVDPRYGRLHDIDKLISGLHERGMMIMIDLIPNHTSDLHPWFIASSDPKHQDHDRYKDFYVWKDAGPNGEVPNNWASVFSVPSLKSNDSRSNGDINQAATAPVSAWKWHEKRRQFYLHSFGEFQPDLNWENPKAAKAVMDNMRFWIERGVDGLRVDAANYIGKDPEFRNEEKNPEYQQGIDNPYDQLLRKHSAGFAPTLYPRLQQLTDIAKEYTNKDLRLVFEAYMALGDLEKISEIDPKHAEAFDFGLVDTPWQAGVFQRMLDDYYANLPKNGIGNQVLGNHDKPRLASRYGSQAARAAALIQLCLPGMIFIYQGEEGGFKDVEIPPGKIQDKPYLGARDKARTPMLWNSQKNAGFSDAQPEDLWLPVDPDFSKINLDSQARDENSFLNFYKQLLKFRETTLNKCGPYIPLGVTGRNVIAFKRKAQDASYVILANASDTTTDVSQKDVDCKPESVVISSVAGSRHDIGADQEQITLRPNEALVIKCQL